MNQTIRGAIALLVSVFGVHTLYEVIITPGALIAQKAIEAGNAEALRSTFIILKDFEQEACLILMLWATYLVVEKMLAITKTNFLFDVDFCQDTEMNHAGITDLVSELEKLKPSMKLSPLVRILRASLRRFLVSNDVHSASEVVDSEVASLVAKNEAGNSMIRYLIWTVPSIGFIGTVRGIGEALSKADEALAGNISGMTSSLGVALNTTQVALLISNLLILLMHQLKRLKKDFAV
jgi:biopolymer transport protein ExbB/TolQ